MAVKSKKVNAVKKASAKQQALVKKAYAKALVKYAFSDPVFRKHLLRELKHLKRAEGEENATTPAAPPTSKSNFYGNLGSVTGGLLGGTHAFQRLLQDRGVLRDTRADLIKEKLMNLFPENSRALIRRMYREAEPLVINPLTKPFVQQVQNPAHIQYGIDKDKLDYQHENAMKKYHKAYADWKKQYDPMYYDDPPIEPTRPRMPTEPPLKNIYRYTNLGKMVGRTALGSILGGLLGRQFD